jgi:hypothetical protein
LLNDIFIVVDIDQPGTLVLGKIGSIAARLGSYKRRSWLRAAKM